MGPCDCGGCAVCRHRQGFEDVDWDRALMRCAGCHRHVLACTCRELTGEEAADALAQALAAAMIRLRESKRTGANRS